MHNDVHPRLVELQRNEMMRFVVIVRKGLDERAFGVYRSFMSASKDARAWDGYVIPIENKDTALNPWDARETRKPEP